MELQELLTKITAPDELIDIREIDQLLFWCSTYLSEAQDDLSKLDTQVSIRELDLYKEHGSVPKAKVHLKVEQIYQDQQALENTIRALKGFKSDLRRRFDLLTGGFH